MEKVNKKTASSKKLDAEIKKNCKIQFKSDFTVKCFNLSISLKSSD